MSPDDAVLAAPASIPRLIVLRVGERAAEPSAKGAEWRPTIGSSVGAADLPPEQLPSLLSGTLTHVNQKLRDAVVSTWLPILRETAEQDANWDWPGKAEDPCFPDGIEHVAIVVADEVQGILVTSLPEEPPALCEIADVLYVEYIASAPWNRKHLCAP